MLGSLIKVLNTLTENKQNIVAEREYDEHDIFNK